GDHGELLGEHGYYAHAHTVYEPVLNIPFLMLRYGYESKAHISGDVVASQIDIAPTILAELDIPSPKSWAGLPLQANAKALRERRFIYFQQQAEYGLFDLSQPGHLWKYRINSDDRSEWAHEVSNKRDETDNRLHEIPAALKTEWIKRLLELQMSAHEYASDPLKTDQALH
ncbi:MAG TPA: hypothetical protein VJU83_11255, partial [Burkholderiales bacterium]|nr:hypothetical protein [Burkholderiales bacterium]